jgi:hypothetical protein
VSLPTLVKTYQYNVNQANAATGTVLTTNRNLLLLLVATLKGFATLPWIVRYSCSSTVAGVADDLVDRWAAAANLVWSAVAGTHSWMVLRRNDGVEILLDLTGTSSSGSVLNLMISPSAHFTGGTTTARPTATDEFCSTSSGAGVAYGPPSADTATRLHVWHSTDATVTHVGIAALGVMCGWVTIASPQPPISSGWTSPVWGMCFGTTGATDVMTVGNLVSGAIGKGRVTTLMNLGLTSEMYLDAAGGQLHRTLVQVNDLTSEWEMYPIGLFSVTASHRGRHGVVFDMWWGSDGVATADTYPNDVTRQFIQFGKLILPWNGSVPVMS